MKLNAELISIGNELLSGFTTNTNASYLSQKLTNIGISVQNVQTIADQPAAIRDALDLALSRAKAILVTGGLGPTHDDITKKVICDHFGYELVFDPKIMENIRERFARRGIQMAAINENQALVPQGAKLMANPVGTAQGMIFEKENHFIFVMPGVPREMKAMVEETLLPFLQEKCPDCRLRNDVFRTTGIAESTIYERIQDIVRDYPHFSVAFLPKFTGVDIRVTRRQEAVQDEAAFSKFARELRGKIGKYIYCESASELTDVLGKLLREKKATLSVAESLTGGLIQHQLTEISGSSAYFMGGAVTYSNSAKISLLGVSEKAIKEQGAVSAIVAEQMAGGVRKLYRTTYAISTTGIAGPTGATAEKPIGLVYIAVASSGRVISKKFQFGNDRRINKERAAQAALEMLRREILEIQ